MINANDYPCQPGHEDGILRRHQDDVGGFVEEVFPLVGGNVGGFVVAFDVMVFGGRSGGGRWARRLAVGGGGCGGGGGAGLGGGAAVGGLARAAGGGIGRSP